MSMLEEFFTLQKLYLAVYSLIVVATVFVVRKIVNSSIAHFCDKTKLDKHVRNMLRMISNIVIYAVGITILLQVWGLPSEWFISISAVTGAAIGFASTQTLGNFLAGLYIMVTRPFQVDDYVKIGAAEGEVEEVNLNYVRIYTPTYTYMEIPNRTVLNSSVTRCMGDDGIDYSFQMSFASKVYMSSWVPSPELLEKIVEPAINEFWTEHGEALPRRPEVAVSSVEFLSRKLTMRMFFPR